jgi:DNA-binding transcriptional regulator YiaG
MNIAELRKRIGMTQEDFAHALGVSCRSVQMWEGGQKPSKLAQREIDKLAKKHKVEV